MNIQQQKSILEKYYETVEIDNERNVLHLGKNIKNVEHTIQEMRVFLKNEMPDLITDPKMKEYSRVCEEHNFLVRLKIENKMNVGDEYAYRVY